MVVRRGCDPVRGVSVLAVLSVVTVTVSLAALAWGHPIEGEGDPAYVDCGVCHPGGSEVGPHLVFDSSTDGCGICHSVHDAPSAYRLLPRQSSMATCVMCHDGTGGYGTYGAIESMGLPVAARHGKEATSVIPGGDAATGGPASRVFVGTGGTLTCDDCHTPHNSNAVAPFRGDRLRDSTGINYIAPPLSNKLLKQRPTGAQADVPVYGSDWCAGCHAGRVSGGAVHNHPVDSTVTTDTPFDYGNVARLDSDGPTSLTVMGSLAGSNRGFLMPSPRTPEQGGHYPICQQCHEDARSVGDLDGATGTAAPYTIVAGPFPIGAVPDGRDPADNPRFQNFPHESTNPRFLVETDDDLCLNCHPPEGLP